MNLTLVSNACMDLHPDNVTTKFRTEFPRLLDFTDGKYEVALTAFQCKKSWNTFIDREVYKITFRVTTASPAEILVDISSVSFSELFSVEIPTGYYSTVTEVVETINGLIEKQGYENYLDFTYHDVSNKISTHFKDGLEENTAEIVFSHDLARKLGWVRDSSYNGSIAVLGGAGYSEKAPHVPRLDEIEQLFVSCDIAQNYHIVGDKETPLLQIFCSKGKFQQLLSYEPKNLVWLPLRRNQFKDAMCIITDATGATIPFESGTAIVRVLIRRVSPFF